MKTNISRRNGIVYTPQEIADEIARFVITKFHKLPESVLEPSVGEGAFISALEKKNVALSKILAVDIDRDKIAQLSEQYTSLRTHSEDFLNENIGNNQKFDLIIGNPPYIKRHNFTPNLAENVNRVGQGFSKHSKNIKNSWLAFLIKSVSLLQNDGVLAFILPYEFMLVNYGQEAQEYIRKLFKSVEIYIPYQKSFPDIDQDAILLVASNRGKVGLFYNRVTTLSDISQPKVTRFSARRASSSVIERVGYLLDPQVKEFLVKLEKELNRVEDYCTSAPGVVTGANDFFVVGKSEKNKFKLEQWVQPIIRKKSFIPNKPIFASEDMKHLLNNHPALLVNLKDCNGTQGLDGLHEYITAGEEQNLTERFKLRNRDPWYAVPRTSIGQGFIFKRAHNFHQVYINEAKALTTDAAYQIHMKDNHSIKHLSFSFHNSLTAAYAEAYGRFYGGGVLELTPKEFRALPICYMVPDADDFAQYIKCFPKQDDFSDNQFKFGDRWLKKTLRLTSDEMVLIQQALKTLRGHRLRHGSRKG